VRAARCCVWQFKQDKVGEAVIATGGSRQERVEEMIGTEVGGDSVEK
jgi:hypothetical protein